MKTTCYNLMGFEAKTLDGRVPKQIDNAAVGLSAGYYMGNVWMENKTRENPRIDVARVIAECGKIPDGAVVMPDIELLIAKLFRVDLSGCPLPAADRLTWQLEIVALMRAVRSTEKGKRARVMPFHSLIGTALAYNGGNWRPQFVATNLQVFLEPVPGAPQGIGALFDLACGRIYRDYQDANQDAANIELTGQVLEIVYPQMERVGLLQPRKNGADWPAKERFDYLSKEQFAGSIAAAKKAFPSLGVWNSGHYGPKGWSVRNGNWYAVKAAGSDVVVGDEFDATDGWAQALIEALRPEPVNSTMQQGSVVTAGVGSQR